MMKFFEKKEFACKCCKVAIVDVELADVLDDVREYFNAPVTITSGYRCEKHNKAVGGAPKSQHCEGIAADIKVSGKAPSEVYKYLNEKYPNKYGIGLYASWTHIDVRETKARWNG
jgi:uncharacterized protein YcbK (DUF882 family)